MELTIQLNEVYALITDDNGVLRIELFTCDQPTTEMRENGYSKQFYEKIFKVINIKSNGDVQEISCN